ncbi:MAG: hypothetical protein H7Z75_06455 [Ferruginibacter sp.]|nr:hypothetical protein [Cytophagales bacterium]
MKNFCSNATRLVSWLLSGGGWVCWVPALAGESFQAPPKRPVYQDIYLIEQPNRLIFGNARLRLEINRTDGEWRSLTADSLPGNLLTPSAKLPSLDFQVDGQRVREKAIGKVLRHQVSLDKMRNGASLEVVVNISASRGSTAAANPAGYAYELTCVYTLFPGEGRLNRSARLLRKAGGPSAVAPAPHFEGFFFRVPGAVLGRPADCVVDVPGPFFPKTYVRPRTPYDSLTNNTVSFHSAPDAGFGILAVSNPSRRKTLATWMNTGGEVNYRPTLRGEDGRITLQHQDYRYYYLPENTVVQSDTHCLELVNGGLPEALARYQRMVTQTMPLDEQTVGWVPQMVLLEAYPKYFPGGIRGLTKKLPFYRKIGFNTLYLMPHWKGGYFPLDLFAVDPAVGTVEDLKEMVRTAHGLGMKVLFDMVIHGFSPESPVVKERPDLFVRGEDDQLALHPTWKSVTTDWASPVYQQYMVNLVLHDLQTYDIDGYRVDAASYKGPGWDKNTQEPAYRSGTAAPELMRKMLQALREKKPEAVLLSEVFGPVFYSVSNLGHDNQTEAVQLLIEKMDRGEVNAADYQAHLANVFSALPPGANRVFFARNHDTSWFYHFNGYAPRFMAVEAIHAFFGIPEVFAGDPDHGPHPDADPGVYAYYQKLFNLRKELPELASGAVLLREVAADNPRIFTGLREADGHLSLVVVSLSDKVENAVLTIQPGVDTGGAGLQLRDVLSGATAEGFLTNRRLTIQLQPFQVLVSRLR